MNGGESACTNDEYRFPHNFKNAQSGCAVSKLACNFVICATQFRNLCNTISKLRKFANGVEHVYTLVSLHQSTTQSSTGSARDTNRQTGLMTINVLSFRNSFVANTKFNFSVLSILQSTRSSCFFSPPPNDHHWKCLCRTLLVGGGSIVSRNFLP